MPAKNTKIKTDDAKKEENKKDTKDSQELLEIEKEVNLVARCKRLFASAQETRRKHDWEWMVRNLYVRGYHFARYNRSSQTIVFSNHTGVRIPINLLWASMRGVRNQVTSFRPKWEVLPAVTTESAFENAKYSSKTLDYIYERSHIKRAIKEVVSHGLLYSVGIWQFEVDDDGNIYVRTVDPYDFYIDPNIRSADINDPKFGAEYVIRSISLPLDAVKKNPNYNNANELEGENKISSSDYKTFLLQVTRQVQNQNQKESPMVILKECWLRERQDDGTFKIRLLTYADSILRPLQNELLDETEFPFELYQGDLTPLEVYGESWAKHLIPINRVIDSLESHIFEYNHLFARGRFVIDKNSGVRVIVNQHGQIIEKNRGSTVTALDIPPLPSAPFEQIRQMRQYFEDISGVHDVSLGRIPSGVRSGTGIAELRQADATNQDDLVDNLEDFLSRAGRRILKLVAENWTTTKLIQATGLGGKPEYFMAVGENSTAAKKKDNKYTFGEMELPLAIIGADNEVRVQVGSWLAYTKQARQEELKDLFRLGAVDQKTLLEHLEFGDIDGILDRTRTEALLQLRRNQPAASAIGVSGNGTLTDEEVALAENEMFLEGKDDPVDPSDDHEVHIAIHKEIINNRKAGDIVKAHINEHINMMRWNQSQEIPMAQPGGGQPTEGGQPNGKVPTPGLAQMLSQMGGGGEPAGGGEVPPQGEIPQGP